MKGSDYDEVLVGLRLMNRRLIVQGVNNLAKLAGRDDTDAFKRRFRLDHYVLDHELSTSTCPHPIGQTIRESSVHPSKTYGRFSLIEIAEIVSENPEAMDYTEEHVPFGKLLLDEIKKAEAKLSVK